MLFGSEQFHIVWLLTSIHIQHYNDTEHKFNNVLQFCIGRSEVDFIMATQQDKAVVYRFWRERSTLSIPDGFGHLSVTLLRVSLGIVFLWFGVLKFFPGLSPAEVLATRTIQTLTLGVVEPSLSQPMLAIWEVLIGLGLITNRFLGATVGLLIVQMLGTFTPLILFPQETWTQFPIVPTLEGQYILKNIVLLSAGLVIGAVSLGRGAMVAHVSRPEVSDRAGI